MCIPKRSKCWRMMPENERFTRLLFRLHGELLMGDRGSMLVELAASWTIIMILTGLYLVVAAAGQGTGGRCLSAAARPARGSSGAICTASPASGSRAWPCSCCSADCLGPSLGAII